MKGSVDTTYQTMQRDMFTSGLAAEIGVNSLAVWLAIKSHADFNSGESWPGVRRLGSMTGLSVGAVHKALGVLKEARLLRVIEAGSGKKTTSYIARERMVVSLGDRVLCTVIVDYVPATLRGQIQRLSEAFRDRNADASAFADCEIVPGDGFVWDPDLGLLRASIPHSDLPGGDEPDPILAIGDVEN